MIRVEILGKFMNGLNFYDYDGLQPKMTMIALLPESVRVDIPK